MAQLALLALTLIALSPLLALGAGIGIVPFALGLGALRRRWARSNDRAQQLAVDLHAGVDELVKSLDLWRCYGAGARIDAAIRSAGERATKASERTEAARAALSGGNEVLGALAVIAALFFARYAGLRLGDGTVVAFCTVLFMSYRPLRDLGDARAARQRGRSALESLEHALPPLDLPEGLEPDRPSSDPTRHPLKRMDLVDFGAARHDVRTTLAVEPGEFVAIVGPSGGGKSTLLHLIAGIDSPTSGSIRVGGRDVAALSERERTLYRRRDVGVVFQFFNLLPHLTVRENVELPRLLDGRADARERAHDLLARVDLAHRSAAHPYELSGGEMQRAAISRALVTGARLLLADEPTGNLDSRHGAEVLALLDSARRERGVTLVLATHSEATARRADRIVQIVDGRLRCG